MIMTQGRRTTVTNANSDNMTFGDHSRAGDNLYGVGAHARGEENQADSARRVFVIHGRDEEARKAVFDFLRALGLHPLEWEQLVKAMRSAAPSLADVVANAPREAQAVVALLTPDDVVQLHPVLRGDSDAAGERVRGCQARPNVFVELGMALAIHPTRTIILEAGVMRRTADLDGLNYVRIDQTARWCNKVAERLQTAGCPVDRSGGDWQDSDRFAGLAAFRRTPFDE
jgi:predicted nucleotide-binding protein